MFPDCPAQPANILRSRYPRSRAGERKPPRGPLLTLAEEPPAPAPPGSPRPDPGQPLARRVLRSRARLPEPRAAKGAMAFALRGATGGAAAAPGAGSGS